MSENKNPLETLAKEFKANAEKMAKGYELMKKVDKVDVATAHKELVWQEDKVRLFRYKSDKITAKIPIVVSYALVNRFDMMDLQPDRSFVRNLLAAGQDVYMIDWGYATQAERYLTMNDYINVYLGGAVDFVRKSRNLEKVNLLGVCQGGTFSAIYSALHPEKIQNLITLVTPFDFSTNDGLLFRWAKNMDVDKFVDSFNGLIPGEYLNGSYAMLKPLANVKKYQDIGSIIEDQDKLMNFLRMEKWVNDSPAQAGECYRQFIKDLYQGNKLIKGELVIGGEKVNLKKITMPVLTVYADADHLVPPASTKPFNDFVGSKDKQVLEFKGGHIGVFVGSRALKELAPTVAKWLGERE